MARSVASSASNGGEHTDSLNERSPEAGTRAE